MTETDETLVFLTLDPDLQGIPVTVTLPHTTLEFLAGIASVPAMVAARLTPLTFEGQLKFESPALAEALEVEPHTLFQGILSFQHHETLTLTLIVRTEHHPDLIPCHPLLLHPDGTPQDHTDGDFPF